MKARGFALLDPSGPPGNAVRRAAAYPGERTGERVKAGELVAFCETATVQHAHSDGNSYAITFYQLADGRGWIHDFSPAKPGNSTLTRGWVIDTSKPGSTDFSTTVPRMRALPPRTAVISTSSSPPSSR
jgi:hypothetical protein